MLKRLYTLPLTALLLLGCTIAPDKPELGASLPPCGPLPNCVNSENGEGAGAIDPIIASPAQWHALKTWLATQPDWTITSDNGAFLQAVAKTPLMRFRDDVQLRFDADAGVIQVRSSSRLGIGDMGANRARVEVLRQQVVGKTSGS
jgi:uncharacterized protein (DUF1499 family)